MSCFVQVLRMFFPVSLDYILIYFFACLLKSCSPISLFLYPFRIVPCGVQLRWYCVTFGEFDWQNGYTALIYAACYGHANCMCLLFDAGADKEAKSLVRVGLCFSLCLEVFVFRVFSSSKLPAPPHCIHDAHSVQVFLGIALFEFFLHLYFCFSNGLISLFILPVVPLLLLRIRLPFVSLKCYVAFLLYMFQLVTMYLAPFKIFSQCIAPYYHSIFSKSLSRKYYSLLLSLPFHLCLSFWNMYIFVYSICESALKLDVWCSNVSI